jgi:hypothetical protein
MYKVTYDYKPPCGKHVGLLYDLGAERPMRSTSRFISKTVAVPLPSAYLGT